MSISKPLEPWPYGLLPSADDYRYGSVHYIVQRTEDGYYGFAIAEAGGVNYRAGQVLASMIGPYKHRIQCGHALRVAAPGDFG